MEVTVYLDVLFALNFLMDLVMVFLTAMVTKTRISIPRLTLSAGILALYGTLIVFPNLQSGYSLTGRLAVSLAGVWTVCPKGRRGKGLLVFWLISVSLGGGVFALSMLTGLGRAMRAMMVNGSLYLDVSMGVLVAGIAVTYGLIWGFCRVSVRNFSRERILIPFCVSINGREIPFTALVDTGCELTVPGTGDAMLLLSRTAMGGAVPKNTFGVPVATAAGGGCVEAFYPERLVCMDPTWQIQGIPAIGISEEVFAGDGLYTAVCNPAMIERKNGGEKHGREKGVIHKALAKAYRVAGNPKTGTGALHRRKRNSAPAPWQGGGSRTSERVGQSGKTARCKADVD